MCVVHDVSSSAPSWCSIHFFRLHIADLIIKLSPSVKVKSALRSWNIIIIFKVD